MRGIKNMQVCSWKSMECTSGLARFIEFNFSDQHAIYLTSRKREFEGSVAQTFICRVRRGESWFRCGLAEPEVQSSLPESHPSCSSVRCAIWICATCWGRSWTSGCWAWEFSPTLILVPVLFKKTKMETNKDSTDFLTPESLNLIESKTNYCLEH